MQPEDKITTEAEETRAQAARDIAKERRRAEKMAQELEAIKKKLALDEQAQKAAEESANVPAAAPHDRKTQVSMDADIARAMAQDEEERARRDRALANEEDVRARARRSEAHRALANEEDERARARRSEAHRARKAVQERARKAPAQRLPEIPRSRPQEEMVPRPRPQGEFVTTAAFARARSPVRARSPARSRSPVRSRSPYSARKRPRTDDRDEDYRRRR